MKGHVDASALAEYAEGLLPRRQRARIASHLADCSECAELGGQLAGVSALLAAAPAPAMPAALADRLEAALTAEVAARARSDRAASGAADTPVGGRARRFAGGRTWRGLPRLGIQSVSLRVAAAAAAAAIVGGGGYALSQVGASETTHGGMASAGGSVQRTKSAPAAGAGSRAVYGPNQAMPYPVASSGTNFQPGTLPAQIRAFVSRYGSTHRNYLSEPAYRKTSGMPVPATGDRFDQCVRGLRMDRQPSLVVLARYAGRPAAVIVFPSAHGQAAWVVATSGGTCPADNPHVLAKVALPAGA